LINPLYAKFNEPLSLAFGQKRTCKTSSRQVGKCQFIYISKSLFIRILEISDGDIYKDSLLADGWHPAAYYGMP
jgi:hypothetical protein